MSGAQYKKLLFLFSFGLSLAITPLVVKAMADDIADSMDDIDDATITSGDIDKAMEDLHIEGDFDELDPEQREEILEQARKNRVDASKAEDDAAKTTDTVDADAANDIDGGGDQGGDGGANGDPVANPGLSDPSSASSPSDTTPSEKPTSGEGDGGDQSSADQGQAGRGGSAKDETIERAQAEKNLKSAKAAAKDADEELDAAKENGDPERIERAEKAQKEAQGNLAEAQERLDRVKENLKGMQHESIKFDNARKEINVEKQSLEKETDRLQNQNQRLQQKYNFREGSVEDNLKDEFDGAGTFEEYTRKLREKGVSEEEINEKLETFKTREEELNDQPELVRGKDGEIDIKATKAKFREDAPVGLENDLKTMNQNESKIQENQDRIEDLDAAYDLIEDYRMDWTSPTAYVKTLGRKLGHIGMMFFEQGMIGFMFMFPNVLVQAIQQLQAARALYHTITEEQNFGQINMKTIPGLIPHENAGDGVFVYWNVPNNGISSFAGTHYFASRDQYGDYFKNYLGSGKVESMIDLTTGAVFNGSGMVTQTMPLFDSKTAPASNNNSSGPSSVQDIINNEVNAIAGGVTQYQYKGFGIFAGQKNVAPSGNSDLAALCRPNDNYRYAPPQRSPYSDIFNGTLKAFNYEGVQLVNNQFRVRQLQGIGAMVFALINYHEVVDTALLNEFTTDNMKMVISNAKSGASSTTTSSDGSKPATEAVSIQDENWTLLGCASQFEQYLFAVSGKPSSMSLNTEQELSVNQGIAPGTQLIGQGIYIYQTADTPIAQYLRTQVHPNLKELMNDYIVCLDQNNSIIPAQVVDIVGSADDKSDPVQWVANPNIMVAVSLITGIAYLPDGSILKAADGSIDYQYANDVLQALPQSNELLQQIGAMRYFASDVVTNGPIMLRKGITAKRVKHLDKKLTDVTSSEIHKQNLDLLLGEAASGVGLVQQQEPSVPLSTKQSLLEDGGGIYIYEISEVLPQSLSDLDQITAGKNPEKFSGFASDYVIPVTVNPTTGDYQIVPLANLTDVAANEKEPSLSTTVLALLSLITGRVYSPKYTPMSNAIRTNVFITKVPGSPFPCCTEIKNPDCPALTVGTISCVDGLQVQQGGINIPLYNAFMESALNPHNFVKDSSTGKVMPLQQNDLDFIAMWPFYFLLLKYDYCPSSLTISPLTGIEDVISLAKQSFTPVSGGATISTTPTNLLNILPESLTGIPWTENSKGVGLGTILDNAAKGVKSGPQAETFTQIHTLWKNALLEKDPWSLAIEVGPFNVTNNGSYDWQVTAEEAALLAGYYFYNLTPPSLNNPLDGLWVAAQYQNSGYTLTGSTLKDAQIISPQDINTQRSQGVALGGTSQHYGLPSNAPAVQRGRNFSLDDFTIDAGTDISSDPYSYNALVNISDGTVLLKIANQSSSGSPYLQYGDESPSQLFVPVVNYYGEAVQLDPVALNQKLNMQLPPSLQAQIDQLQAGNTGDWFGPTSFGPFNLFINREAYNKGHYIYQTFKGNSPAGIPDDYFIVYMPDFSQGAIILMFLPLNQQTPSIASLKTGEIYFATYANQLRQTVEYKNTQFDTSGISTLAGQVQTDLQTIETYTGIPFASDAGGPNLLDVIPLAIKNYIAQTTQKTSGSTQNTSEQSYSEQVMAALPQGNSVVSEIQTLESSLKGLTSGQTSQYQVNNDLMSPLFQINGHYYLQNSLNESGSNWYAFNVASKNENGNYSIPTIDRIPTGVYFQTDQSGDLQPAQVLFGQAAKAFATGHGISVSDQDGSQTRVLPVKRNAIPMLNGVDTDLAGGKTGKLMVMMQEITTPLPSGTIIQQPAGTKNYLYKNIMHLSNIVDPDKVTTSDVQAALERKDQKGATSLVTPDSPYDYYVQVNPPQGQGDPYYISLVSGFTYDIDGQPALQNADVYFANQANSNLMYSDGSSVPNPPMVLWGSGQELSMMIPSNYQNGSNGNPSVFQQYTVSSQNGNVYTMQLLPGDTISYSSSAGNSTAASVDSIQATYDQKDDQWTLINLADKSTIGVFVRNDGQGGTSQNYTVKVWQALGMRTSSTANPIDMNNPQYLTAVTLQNEKAATKEQLQFCFGGSLYGVKSYNINDLTLTETNYYYAQIGGNQVVLYANFMLATSPMLYCSNSTDSASAKFCQDWPQDIQGVQLPHFVKYLSIGQPTQAALAQYTIQTTTNAAGQTVVENNTTMSDLLNFEDNLQFYTYQPIYKDMDEDLLQAYYTWLQMEPVNSNLDYLALVQYVSNPTTLKPANYGNPNNSGETLGDYITRISNKITSYYDSQLTAFDKNREAQSTSFAAAARIPQSSAPSGQRTPPAQMNLGSVNMPNKPFPDPLAKPSRENQLPPLGDVVGSQKVSEARMKSIAYSTLPISSKLPPKEQKAIQQIRAQLEAQRNQILQNKANALAQLNVLSATVNSSSQYFYYDEATGYLLYQVQPGDIFKGAPEPGQYISYPLVPNSIKGGFVFNAQGIPTGAVVSDFDLQTIQQKLGGLKVVSTNPFKLAWPKIVTAQGVQFPNIPALQGVTAPSAGQNSGSSQQQSTSSASSNS